MKHIKLFDTDAELEIAKLNVPFYPYTYVSKEGKIEGENIPMVAIPDNEIWYKTSDGLPITITMGEGTSERPSSLVETIEEDGYFKQIYTDVLWAVQIWAEPVTNITEIYIPKLYEGKFPWEQTNSAWLRGFQCNGVLFDLEKLYISEGATRIGASWNAGSLVKFHTLVCPASMTEWGGGGGFGGMTYPATCILKATTPPDKSAGMPNFDFIYVPIESLDAYKAAGYPEERLRGYY